MTQMNSVRRDPHKHIKFSGVEMQSWEKVAWALFVGFWLGFLTFSSITW